jgi:iron complex outermembrane receptor protein
MAQLNRISLVSLIALGLAMPAMAQNTSASPSGPQSSPQQPPEGGPATTDRTSRDVVVVTAQKREETVQDIAVAVTAITSEMRDQIGLTTVQDYTNFAPGLTYSTASDRLGMRGVTRTSNNFGIRSGISNYVDGVYYSSAIPAGREPIFVDRVEVVRGPQGTLYGRDSIGGALNLISKRPTEEMEGQFNLGAGNYDSMKAEAALSGPITDWLRYRVSGARNFQGEGYLTNVSGLESEAGRRDDTYVEFQLEGDIGDTIDWWAKYGSLQWHRVGAPGGRTNAGSSEPYDTRLFGAPGGANINGLYGLSAFNTGAAANPYIIPGSVVMLGSQTTNPNLGQSEQRKFNTDFTHFTDLYPTTETALEVVYHAPSFDVKYLGGYVWYHYNLQIENDGGPVKQFALAFPLSGTPAGTPLSVDRRTDYNENRAWFSNEINIISTDDGPLQWVTGIYAYQENYSQPIYTTSLPTINQGVYRVDGTPMPDLADFNGRNDHSGSPLGGDLWYFSNNKGNNNAYGAFFQADYQLNDQLKFTAGLRWSQDVMHGADQVRYISQYGVNLGGPARVDLTSAANNLFGGPDPTTVSASNPCGFAGRGIVNANPTTANGVPVGGAAAILFNCGGLNDRSRYGIYVDPATGIATRELGAKFEEVTGVLGVDWTPDDDTLIYGKYNRGYKPGGLGCSDTNCNLTATPFTDKELVDAFELGLKREWGEWNLTTNATLFYYDYQGYQVSNTIVPEPDPTSGIRPPAYLAYVNLPEVNTTGFELETIWRPIDPLRIIFNYGYTDPKIGDTPSLIDALDPFAQNPEANPSGDPIFSALQVTAGCLTAPAGTPNCSPTRGQNLNGNILPFSPKNKIALNGVYTWDFEDGSKIDTSLSYFWQDISYSAVFNRYLTKVPSWDQTDGRISWTSSDGKITLIGFVKNMFDELQYDSRAGGRRIAGSSALTSVLGNGGVRDAPLAICGSSSATSITYAGGQALGYLPQDCYTVTNTYRPPRTWGAELQIRF